MPIEAILFSPSPTTQNNEQPNRQSPNDSRHWYKYSVDIDLVIMMNDLRLLIISSKYCSWIRIKKLLD